MKYVKKPVVIEAFRLCYDVFPGWFETACNEGVARFSGKGENLSNVEVEIATLEGKMLASYGDYIIKGLKGELYPCKADIFEMSYNPVGDYRQRLVLEKEELDDKIVKLRKYLETTEITILREQLLIMVDYSHVLGKRLA